jgi:Trk K+ transport system NAD-binding subunit
VIGAGIYLISRANRIELLELPEAFSQRVKLLIYKLRRSRMQVLIISGGRLGQNIADRLMAKDKYRMMFRSAEHQVCFIEEDEALCKELEKQYNAPIYQGDGTKKEILAQVGVDNVDVVIAASEDDGRNVISALQARQLDHEHVIAIVQDPDYVKLLEKNNVVAISARLTTATMVENYLDRPGLAQLFEFGIGAASILDVTVPKKAQVDGLRIRETKIPKECVIAAIIRDNHFVVPRGDTEVKVDDRVIFIGPADSIKKAHDMFMVTK